MMTPRAVFGMMALASALALGAPLAAPAGPFSAIKLVNDRAITQFEFDQRKLFMQLLRQPGDINELAMQTLVDDRLRLSAADQAGIKLSNQQIQAGMEEFASRANLDVAKFIEIIGQAGVQPQTFRDFVEAGLVWREVVRGKYQGSITVSDVAVERAMASFAPVTSLMLRLSEIEIPATGATRGEALKKAASLRLQLVAGGDFAALARANSAAASAGRGGALDWQKLSDLPKDAGLAVRSLKVGQLSPVVVLDDKALVYRVEEIKQEVVTPKTAVVEYAELLVPDDGKTVATVRANVDSCNDLYAFAKGLPADRLTRQTVAVSKLPKSLAGTLAMLDAGESSAAMTRGGYRVFLMLCRRGPAENEMPTLDEMRLQLINQRLGTMADIYLAELKSEAIIRTP
jgi:peptidyl-prolyl cis-trans isomerase SurA